MIVTLDGTLATDQSVALAAPPCEGRGAPEGNEVEEVEDPPISLMQGYSVTLRRLEMRAAARIRP
jgi:hypothetical protein